jgi:hypothetical protein
MSRLMALLLAVLVLATAAPAAEGRNHVSTSHVPACAAMVGAPCQALLRNWRPGVARLVLLKGMVG